MLWQSALRNTNFDFTLTQFEVLWICRHAAWTNNNINEKAIHKEGIVYKTKLSVYE